MKSPCGLSVSKTSGRKILDGEGGSAAPEFWTVRRCFPRVKKIRPSDFQASPDPARSLLPFLPFLALDRAHRRSRSAAEEVAEEGDRVRHVDSRILVEVGRFGAADAVRSLKERRGIAEIPVPVPSGYTLPTMREEPADLVYRSQQWIDARSLELARATAERIQSEPALAAKARENIERWRTRGQYPPGLREWQEILDGYTLDEVLNLLVEDSEAGRRRRQSSPFVGILPETERRKIFKRYEAIGVGARHPRRERDQQAD